MRSTHQGEMLDKPAGIFIRRLEQLSSEDLVLIQSAARIVLSDENGGLAEQLNSGERPDLSVPALIPSQPALGRGVRSLWFLLNSFFRMGLEVLPQTVVNTW